VKVTDIDATDIVICVCKYSYTYTYMCMLVRCVIFDKLIEF